MAQCSSVGRPEGRTGEDVVKVTAPQQVSTDPSSVRQALVPNELLAMSITRGAEEGGNDAPATGLQSWIGRDMKVAAHGGVAWRAWAASDCNHKSACRTHGLDEGCGENNNNPTAACVRVVELRNPREAAETKASPTSKSQLCS